MVDAVGIGAWQSGSCRLGEPGRVERDYDF
jgi:hypothetical protein